MVLHRAQLHFSNLVCQFPSDPDPSGPTGQPNKYNDVIKMLRNSFFGPLMATTSVDTNKEGGYVYIHLQSFKFKKCELESNNTNVVVPLFKLL